MNKKLNIAAGTTSSQKIGYLKVVLKELGIKAKIVPTDVPSGISDQPLSSKETRIGSLRRARAALRETGNADFSVGIEVGYHKNSKGKYEMFCWSTILDRHNHKVSKQSHRFLLPKYHQNILKNKLYLGENLSGYEKKNSRDSMRRRISEIIRYRQPFISTAVKHALMEYLKKEDYQ